MSTPNGLLAKSRFFFMEKALTKLSIFVIICLRQTFDGFSKKYVRL